MWQSLLQKVKETDFKAIARSITLIENESAGYEELMTSIHPGNTPVIGITGPPGAGKSTLTSALTAQLAGHGKKVAILCVDPSSPFNLGALLGDRIRMNEWHSNPLVYIRSLATRGSLGGLTAKIMEVTDLLKSAGFDYILVETVGIGQSEVEIAGLADVTVVVLVPESGDEVQFMKAGVMEIADVFVINKSDRPSADMLEKNLKEMLHDKSSRIPVVKTIATSGTGVEELLTFIEEIPVNKSSEHKIHLLADKAYQLISREKMKNIDKTDLQNKISKEKHPLNIYRFIRQFLP